RDLARELPTLRVARPAEALVEVAGVQTQAGERVLDLVGDLRRHPAERRERAAPQALELVRVADRDRRLRREEREQLKVVVGGLDARRRLDDERSRRTELDDERCRDDSARLGVAASRAGVTA